MKNNDLKFLFVLLILSLIARVILAILYLAPPDIPHDFYAYVGAGKTILNHGTLYIDTYDGYPSRYGPLFALSMAAFMGLFGENYLVIKSASIFFDMLGIIILFYLVKSIKNNNIAKYVCVIYAFSYVTIWSSGAEGYNNSMFMFFMLLSLYFLVKKNPNLTLSSIFLGISVGYKLTPIVLLPPILYYISKTNSSFKIPINYFLKFGIMFSMILLPFYLMAGLNVFYPYNVGKSMPVDGMSILNFIKMLAYYFIFGSNKPYNTYIFPEWIALPFSIIGFSLALIYIFKYRIENPKLELIRNIFVMIFAGLIFSKTFFGPYILWFLPFVLIIAIHSINFSKYDFSLSILEIIGIVIIIISAIIHAYLYRWFIDYTDLERTLILLGIIAAPVGTYSMLIRTELKLSWSLVSLAAVLFDKMDALVLLLFGSIIPQLQVHRLAWGYIYFISIVLMLISMFLLFRNIHQITRKIDIRIEYEVFKIK